jgi:hypothetical protein
LQQLSVRLNLPPLLLIGDAERELFRVTTWGR